MTDPLPRRYTVALAPHELNAMRELVLYLPAVARALGMPKLMVWSRMIEDVIERVEAEESKKGKD